MKKIISRRVPFQPYYLFCISEDIYTLFIHNGAKRLTANFLCFGRQTAARRKTAFHHLQKCKIRCGGMNFIPPRPFFCYIMFF